MDTRARISYFSKWLRVLLYTLMFFFLVIFIAGLFTQKFAFVNIPLTGHMGVAMLGHTGLPVEAIKPPDHALPSTLYHGGDSPAAGAEQFSEEFMSTTIPFGPPIEYGWFFILSDGVLLLLFLITLFQLERLFALYQQGVFFTLQNTSRIFKLGVVLFAISLTEFLLAFIIEWVIFWDVPPLPLPSGIAELTLVLTLNLDFKTFFVGLFLMLIARVMAEATQLEEEVSHLI